MEVIIVWQLVLLINLLLKAPLSEPASQVELSTNNAVLHLSDRWVRGKGKADDPFTLFYVVYDRTPYRVRIESMDTADAKNSLSASVLLLEVEAQDSRSIPSGFLADRVIEYFCNLPWLTVSIGHAIVHRSDSDTAQPKNLDIQVRKVRSLVKNSHQFDELQVSVSVDGGEAGKIEWRGLIGEVNGKLVVLVLWYSGEQKPQLEQEWSNMVQQLQVKISKHVDTIGRE